MFRCPFTCLCSKKPQPPPTKCAEEELRKEALEAMLTEYSCLREEAQHDDTHQIQLVTITFSTLIAIAGAAAVLFSGMPERVRVFLSFVALPCLAMFMGLLWIDLIYRRTRFGCYTRLLENKINSLLCPNEETPKAYLEWEHWIQALEEGSVGQTRFFRGYVVTGSWIVAPFLIMGAYFLLKDAPISVVAEELRDICRSFWPVTVFMLAVYTVYFSLYFMFVRRIRQFPSRIP